MNPFNRSLELAVIEACEDAQNDDESFAIVLYGGKGKAFNAGGDFKEVKNFRAFEQAKDWIDGVIRLYVSILKVNKPVVAAIDQFAIGIGFQVALCARFQCRTQSADVTDGSSENRAGQRRRPW